MLADGVGHDAERSEVSRLLIVNRAGQAYSGKEVLLIAGELSVLSSAKRMYIYL
jgi:hypothetical protein